MLCSVVTCCTVLLHVVQCCYILCSVVTVVVVTFVAVLLHIGAVLLQCCYMVPFVTLLCSVVTGCAGLLHVVQ